MKKLAALLTVCLLALTTVGQTTNQPIVPTINPSNPPTLDLTPIAKGSTLVGFLANLWPNVDLTLTNTFNAKELTFGLGPYWNSSSAAGNTPFLDIRGDYFFTKHIGFGGDAVTFGNGSGSSDLDSGHAYLIGRKDAGNAAGFLMLGGGANRVLTPVLADPNQTKARFDAEIGVGLVYRWTTRMSFMVFTRYAKFFDHQTEDHRWGTGLITSYTW